MEFGVVKMFFIRFRAFFYFSLVREEDAPHNSLLFIPQPSRVWNDDESDDESYGHPYAYEYEFFDIYSYDSEGCAAL
jgi:hypothetical protein